MKKIIITILKFAIPLAIIAWLLANVDPDEFQRLRERPKNWPMLGGALIMIFGAVSLTFVRWFLLVRALRLRFRMIDAFRLGFLGYLFNFISAGSVGGDLFKAFFIAREQPGRRAEAVATVVVDRMIGLYALFLLTTGVIVFGGIPDSAKETATICHVTVGLTAVGGIGILMLLIPGFTSGALSEFLAGLPKVGNVLGQLITAVRIYRKRWATLVVAIVLSIGTHGSFALSLYLIAHGLFEHVPTWREHLILSPLGHLAGAVPFMPGGLGVFEFALEKLYEIIPAAPDNDVSGVLVALVYRLLTIMVAMIGMVIYWSSRGEVRQLMQEAEHDGEALVAQS